MAIKSYKIRVNGKTYDVDVEEVSFYPETMTTTSSLSKGSAGAQASTSQASHSSSTEVAAPLQGIVLGVSVKVGDRVKKGDVLLKIEAMKMENEIPSPVDGVIESVVVNDGDRVSSGDVLVKIN